jgi:RNA polymerase sigma-70 factor (sigma-E family)
MTALRPGELSTADDAVGELYREHAARVVRLAFLLTGHTGAAEEIAQEAFVAVWRSWDRIRSPDGAYAYLRKTVLNASRSFLRRKALELRHSLARADDAVRIDSDDRVDVLRAVARLPRRQRECVVLRFYEDLTEAETARVLGIAVGTVKSQTFKALRRLEKVMRDDAD